MTIFPWPIAARNCFREPIPEIAEAAQLLNAAASAYLQADRELAEHLIRRANMPEIKEWGVLIVGSE